MSDAERIPVIVDFGQINDRASAPENGLKSLELMVQRPTPTFPKRIQLTTVAYPDHRIDRRERSPIELRSRRSPPPEIHRSTTLCGEILSYFLLVFQHFASLTVLSFFVSNFWHSPQILGRPGQRYGGGSTNYPKCGLHDGNFVIGKPEGVALECPALVA